MIKSYFPISTDKIWLLHDEPIYSVIWDGYEYVFYNAKNQVVDTMRGNIKLKPNEEESYFLLGLIFADLDPNDLLKRKYML